MKIFKIRGYALLSIVIMIFICITGCSNKNKEIVIYNNAKTLEDQEESQIKKNLELGDRLLEQGKDDEAKKAYEKAIKLNKKDKDTYIAIKDKYLSKGETEEAYHIIEEAIVNGVDKNYMNGLLAEIQQMEKEKEEARFKTSNVKHKSVPQKSQDNNEQAKQEVKANPQPVQTVSTKKIFIHVNDVTIDPKDEQGYIIYDEDEYFQQPEAGIEAQKDGVVFFGGVYIRKIDSGKLKISKNCVFDVMQSDVYTTTNTTSDISLTFYKFVDVIKQDYWAQSYYWAYIENGEIVRLESQYLD